MSAFILNSPIRIKFLKIVARAMEDYTISTCLIHTGVTDLPIKLQRNIFCVYDNKYNLEFRNKKGKFNLVY